MKTASLICLAFSPLSFLAAPYLRGSEPRRYQIQTVYVIPSSHWDLGFIAPPEKVLPRLTKTAH
jgi:hypothetical protein